MDNWDIYKITNPDGGVYIGKTKNLTKRIKWHKTPSPRQPVLYNSIKKHGFASHSIEVIDSFEGDFRYANGKEVFWIRTFMSNSKKYPEQRGLNMTDGGVLIVSEDVIAHIKNKNKGKVYGYEHRKRLSIAHLGQVAHNRTPILQYDLDGTFIKEYQTLTDAAKEIGILRTSISNVLSGRNTRAGKYFFKYKNK